METRPECRRPGRVESDLRIRCRFRHLPEHERGGQRSADTRAARRDCDEIDDRGPVRDQRGEKPDRPAALARDEQGITALIAKPEQPPVPPNWKPGGYLEKLPKDPWGRPYVYLNPGVRGEIEVFSFGADGQPGGTGFDADVGSWDL